MLQSNVAPTTRQSHLKFRRHWQMIKCCACANVSSAYCKSLGGSQMLALPRPRFALGPGLRPVSFTPSHAVPRRPTPSHAVPRRPTPSHAVRPPFRPKMSQSPPAERRIASASSSSSALSCTSCRRSSSWLAWDRVGEGRAQGIRSVAGFNVRGVTRPHGRRGHDTCARQRRCDKRSKVKFYYYFVGHACARTVTRYTCNYSRPLCGR